ncbi:MAG TPA: hypothetical protein VFL85_05250 [Candidatus Saccharimonadales bacterium]|nr:hypothetical protein [Candidatus Saccharimonadales bacterium]
MPTSRTFPKQTAALYIGSAILIAAIAVFLWWQFVYQNPRHVFDDMLANNLQTTSVTKQQKQGNGSQSVTQTVRLQLGSTNATDWLVTINQANSRVTTESIGTPNAGYVRYLSASTKQKRANGKAYDFSKLLNVWGKADTKDSKNVLNQLFSQTMLDIGTAPLPPLGNLQPDDRQNILDFMQEQSVFNADYNKVTTGTVDGRPVYIYPVTVKLEPYLRMMQAFARDNGMRQLDAIEPSQYRTAPAVKMTFKVDRWSHQLRQVQYDTAKFSQTYTDYGLKLPIQIPRQTIPVTDLQNRLQKL